MQLGIILNYARHELVDRYAGSVLGGAWSFILPLVQILIFTLIFSEIMGAKMAALGAEFEKYGYSIYLISGILAWNAFSGTLSRVTGFYEDHAGVIKKVPVDLMTLPVYVVIADTVIHVVAMAFFAVFLILIGFPIGPSWLALPLVYGLQAAFAYGLGFFLANLAVFLRDVRELVSVVLQVWFWLTPIVYVVEIVPGGIGRLLALNPMFHVIGAYRDIVVARTLPDPAALAYPGALAVLFLAAGLLMFRRLERHIRDLL
jgi:lipopolysaccharide transport system permease protein